MIISIDTALPISETDKVILLALAGELTVAAEPTPVEAEPTLHTTVIPFALDVERDIPEPTTESEYVPDEPKPAAEAPAGRRRRTRCKECGELHFPEEGHAATVAETPDEPETEAPVTAAVSEPAPVEAEEVASSGEDAASLREQAIKTATALVAAGEAAKVRKVLNEIGVRRVSEIKDGDLQRFLAAVA